MTDKFYQAASITQAYLTTTNILHYFLFKLFFSEPLSTDTKSIIYKLDSFSEVLWVKFIKFQISKFQPIFKSGVDLQFYTLIFVKVSSRLRLTKSD